MQKPTKQNAQKLIKKNALWNTGIIVVKNEVLVSLFNKYSKDLYQKSILSCKKAKKENEFYVLDKTPLQNAKSISMDYAILEKNFRKLVIPFNSKWSDLGTYDSIFFSEIAL